MLAYVVERDEDYAEIIAHTVERDGHSVLRADSMRSALMLADRRPPELAVIDMNLPDGSGIDVCKRLRKLDGQLPVILVSSEDRCSDIIAGLDAGGDDYVAKPFHPGVLLARLRAVLRRSRGEQVSSHVSTRRICSDGLEVDLASQTAFLNGINLHCTPLEVEILGQLVQFAGQALSHGYLTEQIWGYKNVHDATLLKGHVSSIRRKIRDANGDEDVVRTVHGVGYSFTPV
ncbi:MAG: response regulator transcription factor [Dehalococcoidia bacterium]